MEKNFKHINPCKLYDELILNNIPIVLVQNDCKNDDYIAENTWITFEDDVDMNKVNEIVSKHNPTPVVKLSQNEILISKLLKDNASIQLQLLQQQKINANILIQIGKIGGV